MAQTSSAVSRNESQEHTAYWPAGCNLDKLPLDARDWDYLAEGGESLLARFVGDRNKAKGSWTDVSGDRALALRLNKVAVSSSDATSAHPTTLRSKLRSTQPTQKPLFERSSFEADVVARLLGQSKLLPFTSSIAVSQNSTQANFLAEAAGRLEVQRPATRRQKDRIDTGAEKIQVVEDLSWSGTSSDDSAAEVFAAEIKPKWLFDPDSLSGVSRYRRHRVLKSDGQMTAAEFDTLYEPLDLVSDDAMRIDRAVKGLVDDWTHGGNNLRLFWDGRVLEPSDTERIKAAAQSVCPSHDHLTSPQRLARGLTRCVSTAGTQKVLARLARLQGSLSPLDIQGLAGWWSAQTGETRFSLAAQDSQHGQLLCEPTLAEYKDFVTDWIEANEVSNNDSGLAVNLRQAIIGTLLSATFKDCSIFLRISGTPASAQGRQTSPLDPAVTSRLDNKTATAACEADHISTTGEPIESLSYISGAMASTLPEQSKPGAISSNEAGSAALPGFTLRLIDLAPKPIRKLDYWQRLDRDIETAYQQWQRST